MYNCKNSLNINVQIKINDFEKASTKLSNDRIEEITKNKFFKTNTSNFYNISENKNLNLKINPSKITFNPTLLKNNKNTINNLKESDM